MKKGRIKFSPVFKTKVMLESIKEASTLQELARKYSLHPTQITAWKREFMEKWIQFLAQRRPLKRRNPRKRNYTLKLENFRSRLIS
ncbi:transposase [Chryseobacterium polytrichastri]|uniref:transposase n=1 Tax=Chryseobacterium polytrichastri TaxID=1302687 RepID=UPI0011147137|nr:transposase [Chryseobacterium polytrichastri]